MASTHQSQISIHNLSKQKNMQKYSPPSTPVSFQLEICGYLFIVTFDKHRVIVRKNKANIIEGYWGPMNGFWCFPLHDSSQGSQQSNMISHITSKHWCQHIKPMTPRRPRAYRPTYQQELTICYHHIFWFPKKLTLLQEINDGSFTTWIGLKAKLITNYLSWS